MTSRLYQIQDSLLEIPGIGPTTYLKLSKRGLKTVADLLHLYPNRYEDYSQDARIASLEPEEKVTITAIVVRSKNTYTRKRGLTIQNLTVKDPTGELDLTWFNQPFVLRAFKTGHSYRFSGKVTIFRGRETLTVAEFEPAENPNIHTGKIIPIYSEAYGVSSKFLRQRLEHILNNLDLSSVATLGKLISDQTDLLTPREALYSIHFPKNNLALKRAQEHYLLNELLNIRINHLRQAAEIRTLRYPSLTLTSKNQADFISNLPFNLTPSQSEVIKEINGDFQSGNYMNRLLMGDVGSGKTVIMAYLSFLMSQNNHKTLVLVPTEALAQQHFQTMSALLKFSKIKVACLTASQKTNDLTDADIIIGTQALFFKKADLPEFGLLIIDEQHKFGVKDREKLLKEVRPLPHLLTVSATPIPRSLAQSIYGQVTTSYLKEKPFKSQVKTFLVKEDKRLDSYRWIEKTIQEQNIQAFVICASVEKKETPTTNEIKAVKAEYQKLTKEFPTLSIGAVYSKHREKSKILADFRKGDLDILISTSLVEVGIDIPDANLMIIENAERFGLSQLHQMRGRIGRRDNKAYCLLFTSSQNPDTLSRLRVLETTTDALIVAQKDLELRGPGNLLGTEQHGFSFITLKHLLDVNLNSKVERIAKELLAKQPNLDYTTLVA